MKPLDSILGPRHLILLIAAGLAGAAALPDGNGGLAGLRPADVEALRKGRDALERIVADQVEHPHVRRDAAVALGRIHEALSDWGRPGQLEWYIQQIQQNPPEHLQVALVSDAQAAARARHHHFAGVHQFWRTLDDLVRSRKIRLAGAAERARRAFRECIAHLAKKGALSPTLETFKITIPPFDVRTLLKPLPEPKQN